MSSDEKCEFTDQGLPAVDIENPVDTDVLCGRGGAALRHPGNQTYRRLVHLNKGLYITCLKAEKLKISRSIVAAIREQKGRFLERDTKKDTWYDIGDKKAMEKTSQALREGQPKLRQQIVELGGGAAGAAALLETQFPGGSAYSMNHQQQAQAAQIEQQTMQHLQQQKNIQEHNMQQQSIQQHNIQQHQDFQQQQMQNMQQQGMFNSAEAMPPPRSRCDDLGGMMGNQPQPQAPMSMMETPTIQEEPGSMRGSAGNLGIDQYAASQFSLMSDFSSYAGMDQPLSGGGGLTMPPPISTPGSLGLMDTSNSQSSRKHHNMDRRKHFAHMKYSRPPSGRFNSGSNRQLYSSNKQLYASNRSLGADGMPDIHLVESNPSLFSNLSAHSGGEHARVPDIANIFESRRSMMSGMSRISDASEMNSIFSDLSRKIGNVSTRSIAMSEISNMDEHELHELDPLSIPTDSMDEFPGEM